MPKSIVFNDTKHDWLNLLCAIGSVRGWRCNLMDLPMKNPKHNDQWILRMIKGQPLNISFKTAITHEAYKPEMVWCVRTTSKNIITRRGGKVTVMGNTEGWDCPSVDCIVCLRPTKIRSLYCQIIGRGTRIHTGKDHLLLLDFLWLSERHELCRPAHLIATDAEVAQKMTANINEAGCPVDLEAAERQAEGDCVADREARLAEKLKEMQNRKRKLVDPLQFEMSIAAQDLASYVPTFGWELNKPTPVQLQELERAGIFPDEIDSAGKASLLLNRLRERRAKGLSTAKQIRFLEGKGFQHVGTWDFDSARKLIDRIAGNNWRTPPGIDAASYKPKAVQTQLEAV